MSHAHHWSDGLFAGFRYCLKCGLVWLHNVVTRKAIKKPCPGADADAQ